MHQPLIWAMAHSKLAVLEAALGHGAVAATHYALAKGARVDPSEGSREQVSEIQLALCEAALSLKHTEEALEWAQQAATTAAGGHDDGRWLRAEARR